MTKDDFEKRLRTTPLIEPDPHWREEILANCSQRHSYWWVKVIGMAALLGIAGLSVHLWPHQKDVQNIHPIANHTSPSPERSIIPGFKLKSSQETFWDQILLKESAEIPQPQSDKSEVIAFLSEHQEIMDRFVTAMQLQDLALPDPLPIARMRQTSEAFLWKAFTLFDQGNSQAGVEACLAPFPLIHLLDESDDMETTITHVGLVGISIFSTGRGIDFAATDQELRLLQEALEELNPLRTMVEAVDRWLTTSSADQDQDHAKGYIQAWLDAWDAEASGFRLEDCPKKPDRFKEPINEGFKRYRNVIADAADVECRMRHVIIALIIERYRRIHGEVPDHLEELIPDFTDHVPNSPWTGKPFHYEKIASDNARMSSERPTGMDRANLLLRPLNDR